MQKYHKMYDWNAIAPYILACFPRNLNFCVGAFLGFFYLRVANFNIYAMENDVDIVESFLLQNRIEGICESDYEKAGLLIEAVKAFERSTYQCVYVIDYFRQGFLHVSRNVTRLCGGNAEKITDFGYRFYADYVPREELKMMLEINDSAFDFFYRLPVAERREYTISYDFHIRKNNRLQLVNHKVTPLALTGEGRIWLAICTISLATGSKAGNVIMKRTGAGVYFQYAHLSHTWEERQEVALTDSEREALSLSAQGYTMGDIAECLGVSVDAVKARKHILFKKMEVSHIAEAITYAQNHQLI